MEDNCYKLILAYFEKTISDDGLTQLQDWIEESKENLAQFSETIQILEASRLHLKTPERTEQSWAKVYAHATSNPGQRRVEAKKRSWLAVAAACFVISMSGWWGFKSYKDRQQPEYATFVNADGKHAKILLPDHSIVVLSGGSTLKYVKNFEGDKRLVILDGEAFFEVVHQPKKMFVVKTGAISTVVLGTSFNIKAYRADKNVAVTVLTGKVGILAYINSKSQLIKCLTPNEQININTQTGIYTSNTTDATSVTAWINYGYAFYNTSFKDIAASLAHHYGVKIDFTDPDLGNTRLTAKFKNLGLNRAMDILCSLSGLAYTQKNKQLFISQTNQKGGSIMR